MIQASRRIAIGKTSTGASVVTAYGEAPSGGEPAVAMASRSSGMPRSSDSPATMISTSGGKIAMEVELAGGHAEIANSLGGLGLPVGAGASQVVAPAMMLPVLDGFIVDSPMLMHRLYRDLYAYDPTIGPATELLSTLPLGDFSLSGFSDEKRMQKFAQAIDNMKLRQLLPVISTDYLVLGAFCGTTRWSSAQSTFVGLSAQNIDLLQIEPVPIQGEEPIIKLNIPAEILKLLNSGDEDMARFKDMLPEEFTEAGGSSGAKGVKLNPKNLIFLARPGLVSDYRGVSFIRRCLPIALIERALIRGTLDITWKRQRSILHIMLGDDMWQPTKADYEGIAKMFANADHDPTGAIIATRHGIDINLVDRATEGLKYMDVYDFAQSAKLRAMGINESLFGLDYAVTAAEGSINLAMMNFAAYRDHLTQALFYRNMFPAIAVANGYRRQQTTQALAASRFHGGHGTRVYRDPANEGYWRAEFAADRPDNLSEMDLSRYAIPKIEWHNRLEATDTAARMDMLSRLAEQGIPVPLRSWASAAGLTLEHLAESRDSDMRARKFFEPWKKAIARDKSIADGSFSGGGGEEEASVLTGDSYPVGGSVVRKHLLDRQLDPGRSVPGIEVGGRLRPRTTRERAAYNDKVNRNLAEAGTTVARHHQKKANARHADSAKRKFYTTPRSKA